jgi:membrane protease YdiL (CAAX protease family)
MPEVEKIRNINSDSQNPKIILPPLQVLLILVGLPCIYMANSLMPWSIGLLRQHNHAYFFPFWTSIALLHWSTVALIIILLKRRGVGLAHIGLTLSPVRIALIIGIPIVVGVSLILLRSAGIDPGSKNPEVVSPATMEEKCFWIFMSFTAGFCEELVYRGFAIRSLQGLNLHTGIAILIATLSFVLMHGVSVLTPVPFVIIYVAGLFFSALFVWRRSLTPGIFLHTLFDLMSIR